MQLSVSYIPYATSSYEQTGYIITFAQFEEVNLVENEWKSEDGSISASIDELSADNDSDYGSIITNALEDIQGGSQIHP